MKKWFVLATVSAVLLTACNVEKAEDLEVPAATKAETDTETEVNEASNLLEEMQLHLDEILFPKYENLLLPITYITIHYNQNGQLSGNYELLDFERDSNIAVRFGPLEDYEPTLQNQLKGLSDRDTIDIENGVIVKRGDTYYEVSDFQSNRKQLLEATSLLTPYKHYVQFVTIDSLKYIWPKFLPYGEPTSVTVQYNNPELINSTPSHEFSTLNQSVGYFNDTIAFWQYNKPVDPFSLNYDQLFMLANDARAYYSPKDDHYLMTMNIRENNAYTLKPIGMPSGANASIYYEKPQNWEAELEKVFTTLVKENGLDVASIQNGTIIDGNSVAGTGDSQIDNNSEKLEQLDIIDGKFYVYGLTVGTTQKETEQMYGSPSELYNDESGFVNFIAIYNEPKLKIGYIQNANGEYILADITANMKGNRYHTLLNSKLSHDPYRYESDPNTSYFYEADSNQVVKLIPDTNQDYEIMLTSADPNFTSQFLE